MFPECWNNVPLNSQTLIINDSVYNNNNNNNSNNNNNNITMGTFDLNLPGQFPFIEFFTSFSSFTFRLVNVLLGLK